MTTDEIEKAVSDYSKSLESIAFENLKGEEMPYLLRGAFKEGLEIINKHWQEKTRWIPVEERLPNNDKRILVKGRTNIAYLSYYSQRNKTFTSQCKVTHWKEIE